MFDVNRYPKRLSIALPEDVAAQLDDIARRCDVPVASVVRECIKRGLPSVLQEVRQRDVANGDPDVAQ